MRTANNEPPETGPRPLTTLSVVRETGRVVHQAAKYRDLTIPEFIEKYLRPAILREYRAALEQATAELESVVLDDRD